LDVVKLWEIHDKSGADDGVAIDNQVAEEDGAANLLK